jgi:hypothetical protein
MRADDLVSPRPTPEDLEDACRETEHAVLASHRKSSVPLVLWRNGRVVKLDPADPAARVSGAPPVKH